MALTNNLLKRPKKASNVKLTFFLANKFIILPYLVPAWIEGSKANDGEVDIVLRHVLALLKAGLKGTFGSQPKNESKLQLTGEEIGVISPYNAQVDRLRAKLRENQSNTEHASERAKIEISTVDGFQVPPLILSHITNQYNTTQCITFL